MAKTLLIEANPNPQGWSMKLAAEYEKQCSDDLEILNLYEEEIQYYTLHDLTTDYVKRGENLSDEEAKKLTYRNNLIEQFLSADTIVIASPMWNFTVPAILKAYIDMIVAPGRTFKMGENGPEGLVTGKKLVILAARGGDYSSGEFDFQVPYLKAAFGFLGIQEQEAYVLEGTMMPGVQERFDALCKEFSEK